LLPRDVLDFGFGKSKIRLFFASVKYSFGQIRGWICHIFARHYILTVKN